MGYCVYDVDGYVGDLASNKGLSDLAEYIKKHPDLDELETLFEKGSILKNDDLLKELDLVGIPKDEDIAETLSNLKELAKKASHIVILTQEAETEEEE